MATLASLAATLVLGACSSKPVAPESKPVQPVVVTRPSPASTPQASTQATATTVNVTPPFAAYLDPASLLNQKRSIYFDFDQSIVKPDFAPTLELHGKFLASHPNVAIRVEGNTDEQGGTEYNLALGQKRAEAVTKALKLYGVKDSQMEAVSFGEEKPKATGHAEADYAQNRRADIAYPSK
ncbi:MAG: peptidoglycan-associated lipoprotein Pal [Rhodoferax sp.]|nr:peptidoglycan-associated lipoprotein Pal [Rhodoferax sp.]